MSMTFKVGGRVVDESTLLAMAPPKRAQTRRAQAEASMPTTDRAQAKISMGWAVEGYSPAQIADARAKREAARAAAIAAEVRAPAEFDDEAFMNSAKPRRVRSKPYDIEAAARQCAALAEKQGWLRVTVHELLRT